MDCELPEKGFVLLDTFVLSDSATSSNATHLRLLLVSGDMQENWEELQRLHNTTYQSILTEVPDLPANAQMLAHLACSTDAQLEYGYTILRDVAEKIAKYKQWIVSDISLRKPSYRESENLDVPFLKMLQKNHSRADLTKRPLTFREKEDDGQIRIASYFTVSYSIGVLVFALLVALIISTTLYEVLTLPGTIVVDLLVVFGLYLSFLKEYLLILDGDGIEYHENRLYFGLIRTSIQKEFMPWPEVEEIQVMPSNQGGPDREQFVVISDDALISVNTNYAQWLWQRVMIWICEHKTLLEPHLQTIKQNKVEEINEKD